MEEVDSVYGYRSDDRATDWPTRLAIYPFLGPTDGVAPLDALAKNESVNAGAGWLSAAVVAFVVVQSVLTGTLLWAGVAAILLVVGVLPPIWTRDWRVMAPWPLLLVSTIAVLLGGFGIAPEVAGYFVVAGIALLTAVEIDAFTSVEMSRRFAVAFAVLATLAVQGLWVIAQYYSDLWLDTAFLQTQRELQVDIVVVTVVGLVMGAVFEWYFERVEHVGSHRHPNVPARSP